MATNRRVSFIIGANAKQFYKTLSTAQQKFQRFGRKMKRVGSTMTQNITMPLALAGGASLKMAVDFEKSMTKINTLVGVSSDRVNQMKDSVINLSNETGKSSGELADALFAVTSAGLRGKEAMQVLEQSAKASAVGLGETKQIARTTTAIINAYGKENITASEATDKLTAIVREGNLEAEELAGSIGRILGVASQLGVSFDEVGASIATYTRLGVNADEASTGLRAILNSLIKTTPAQKEAFKELGTSADEVRKRIGEQGLASTLTDLLKRADGNNEVLGELIPNVRALSAVLGTAGSQGDEYAKVLEGIQNSSGLVNEGFEKVSETASQKFNKALQNLTNLGIKIGSQIIPVFNKVIDKVSKVITWFSELSTQTKAIGITIAGIFAVSGPVITAIGYLATAFGALFSPIGAVIALIAGLVVVGKNVVDNWDVISAELGNLWDGIKLMTMKLVNGIVKGYGWMFKKILGIMRDVAGVVAPSMVAPLGAVEAKVDEAMSSVQEKTDKARQAFIESKKAVIEKRQGIVSLKDSFNSLWNMMGNGLNSLAQYVGLTQDATKETSKLAKAQQQVMNLFNSGAIKGSSAKTFETDPTDSVSKDGEGLSGKKAKAEHDTIQEAIGNTQKKYREFSEDLANNITPMISNALGQATGAFIEMGVQASMSGKSMKGVFLTVLTNLADLAIRVGKIAIATGLAIEGIKKALQSLNPAVAIGAGIALVALGSAVKSALSKSAEGKGEGESSGSGIPQMAQGGIVPAGFPNDSYPALLSSGETVIPSPKKLPSGMGSGNINLSGQFRVKGTDLVLILEKAKQTLR